MAQKKFVDEDGKELSIEAAFGEIRLLLGEMEQENTTLEKSFENYERGMQLLRYCSGRIDQVEKKVQKLSDDGTTEEYV